MKTKFILVISSLLLLMVMINSSFVHSQEKQTLPGEQLFKDNCAACHTISKVPKVGPGLLGITQRQTQEQIKSWTANHNKRVAYGDSYAKKVYEKYGKCDVSPIFLSGQQHDAFYEYFK